MTDDVPATVLQAMLSEHSAAYKNAIDAGCTSRQATDAGQAAMGVVLAAYLAEQAPPKAEPSADLAPLLTMSEGQFGVLGWQARASDMEELRAALAEIDAQRRARAAGEQVAALRAALDTARDLD